MKPKRLLCIPIRLGRRNFHVGFMRRYFDSVLQTEMLLRVVAEETETELAIVTLYKTSKFKKYEGEQKQ
jgi:hypothetical protein